MMLQLERANGDHLSTRALEGTSGTEFGIRLKEHETD